MENNQMKRSVDKTCYPKMRETLVSIEIYIDTPAFYIDRII